MAANKDKSLNGDNLVIVAAEDRDGEKSISSMIYSRAIVFYPAIRKTPKMKKRLDEIHALKLADKPTYNIPLDEVILNIKGVTKKISIHEDFLLQTHRDVLDSILANSDAVTLIGNSDSFSWRRVLNTVAAEQGVEFDYQADESAISSVKLSEKIPKTLPVLSIPLYKVAKSLGMQANHKTYNSIIQKVHDMAHATIYHSTQNPDGTFGGKEPLNLVKMYLACRSPKNRNSLVDSVSAKTPNHILVVMDALFFKAISADKHYLKKDYNRFQPFKTPSLKSFLIWLSTHNNDFLDNKSLKWLIDEYVKSTITEVGGAFKYQLRDAVMANIDEIEKQFKISFVENSAKANNFKLKNMEH